MTPLFFFPKIYDPKYIWDPHSKETYDPEPPQIFGSIITRVIVTTSEDYHPDQIPQFLSRKFGAYMAPASKLGGGGKRKFMGKKGKNVHEACKIYHFYAEIKFLYHIWNYLSGY